MKEINREYKDRVFKFIFGNPTNKEWTLSLYNAVNGSAHRNPDDIRFNTLEDAVYMNMKNDVSFIIMSEMSLWEHQSTFNPNMPMRFFIYGGRLFEKHIAVSEYYRYSHHLQKVPKPHCICFYNGRAEQPERQVLKLSDAFCGDADIEVKVTMLNINYGKNRKLMEACEPLREYAWLVDAVRRYHHEVQDLEVAVDAAIREMSDSFAIRPFLIGHQAEVRNMFVGTFDEEREREKGRLEAHREGLKEGRKEGRLEAEKELNERVATDMLKEGEPIPKIVKYSKLSEAAIRKLAKSLGVAVL